MAKRKTKPAPAQVLDDRGDWRAQDDLRTLSQAAEISRDKKRMSAAKVEAKKQMKSLHLVVGRESEEKLSSRAARRKRLEDVDL